MSGNVIPSSVRQNLQSLQNTSAAMSLSQNRLATGLKVSSALDNPTNFFTAASLSSRSTDLSALIDNMSNGVKTIEAADNGLKSITKTVESMQATVRQARQDKSWQGSSYAYDAARTAVSGDKLSFSGGSVGTTAISVSINSSNKSTAAVVPTVVVGDNGKQFTVSNGTTATADISLATSDTVDGIVTKINAATTTAGNGIVASNDGGKIKLTSAEGDAISVAEGTTTGGAAVLGFAAATTYAGKSLDQIVTDVNAKTGLTGNVKASIDAGKLRIENISTADMTVVGATSTAVNGLTGGTNTQTIGGNSVRKNLITQFNDLRDQLDKFANDASFNGINLLKGDKLKMVLNETNTSSIEIQSTNTSGVNVGALAINASATEGTEFRDDTALDARLDKLTASLGTLRSQSSSFGSKLSVVQNRQDFTKSMINTLQGGADSLVMADANEEAANVLALQTRQQLSTTAMSLANQAAQGVLRLF